MAIQPQTKRPVPKKVAAVPKRAAQPQKYFTYKPSDPRSHLKIKVGQQLAYRKAVDGGDGGYYAVPKVAKPTVVVTRAGTSQNQSSIETPAQIEERVKRMAKEEYTRQQGDLDTEVAKMRKEAEGRRLAMIAAYQAAGTQNAAMAGQVQSGWNTAADTLQGIAGATTGGIGDALRADVAAQEQALSRVGAGGTGFDATSQQAVEQFRGGALPAESFARYGGIANEYLQRMPDNLKRQGLASAYSTENADLAKIAQDRLTQVRELGTSRVKYESDLREELLGARGDQIKAVSDANELMAKVRSDQAKLKFQYWEARANATTKKELQAVEMIYKNSQLELKGREADALIAQREAGAKLSTAKANDLINNPGGSGKPINPGTAASVIKGARDVGLERLDTIRQRIWDQTPGHNPPAGWDKDKQGSYKDSPGYAAAVAKAQRQYTASFGTANAAVIRAITQQLKGLKWTDAQIRKMAYEIVTSAFTPPKGWKTPPGYKAAKKPPAASPVKNVFTGGLDLTGA